MALLILALAVFCLFVLQRFGVLREYRLSWDMICRMFLNILTIIGVLTVLVTLWSVAIVTYHMEDKVLAAPITAPPVAIASSMILAFGLIGVWRRRKWSAWVILGRLLVTIGLEIYAYHSFGLDLFRGRIGADNALANLIGLVLWSLAFAVTRKHFGHSDYGKHAKARSAALSREDEGDVAAT